MVVNTSCAYETWQFTSLPALLDSAALSSSLNCIKGFTRYFSSRKCQWTFQLHSDTTANVDFVFIVWVCFSMYKLRAETRRHFKSREAAKHLARFFKKYLPASHNTALATVSVEAYLQFCSFICLNIFKDQSVINRFLHCGMVTQHKGCLQKNPKILTIHSEKIKVFFSGP